MVSVGEVTTPPMLPVVVLALEQSRVVETKNAIVDAMGGPIVMAVKVSV